MAIIIRKFIGIRKLHILAHTNTQEKSIFVQLICLEGDSGRLFDSKWSMAIIRGQLLFTGFSFTFTIHVKIDKGNDDFFLRKSWDEMWVESFLENDLLSKAIEIN